MQHEDFMAFMDARRALYGVGAPLEPLSRDMDGDEESGLLDVERVDEPGGEG